MKDHREFQLAGQVQYPDQYGVRVDTPTEVEGGRLQFERVGKEAEMMLRRPGAFNHIKWYENGEVRLGAHVINVISYDSAGDWMTLSVNLGELMQAAIADGGFDSANEDFAALKEITGGNGCLILNCDNTGEMPMADLDLYPDIYEPDSIVRLDHGNFLPSNADIEKENDYAFKFDLPIDGIKAMVQVTVTSEWICVGLIDGSASKMILYLVRPHIETEVFDRALMAGVSTRSQALDLMAEAMFMGRD